MAKKSLNDLLSRVDSTTGNLVKVKKLFDGKMMECVLCRKKGHNIDFCPSKATIPQEEDRSSFVDSLVNSSRLRLDMYRGLSWEEVWEKLLQEGARLNVGNPWLLELGPEFHLKKNLGFWKAIGADKTVMSWIGYGVDVCFVATPAPVQFGNSRVMSERYENFVDGEIEKHVKDGLAVQVGGSKVHIVHPMLVVENTHGKRRLCDDMRWSNAFQASPSFKMQSLEHDIPELVQPGEILFTRDLEKAYYKVMMAPRARKFQNRAWKGNFYQMCCLLFGMCNAPFVFTKICRPIVRFFGSTLAKLLNFIDDWLLSAEPSKIGRLKTFFENVLNLLGWTFNDKGEEGHSVMFLGYIVDAVKREFSVPECKIVKARGQLRALAETEQKGYLVRTESLLSLLGQIGSMRLAIPSVSCWSRELYSPWQGLAPVVKQLAGGFVVVSAGTAPLWCRLTKEMIGEISMLDDLLAQKNGAPFMKKSLELDLFCDASETGWGCFVLQEEVTGLFSSELIGKSSTLRELSGLLACLKSPQVEKWVGGTSRRINMDSAPAIANLTKGGGPIKELCVVVKALDLRFQELKLTTFFRWLARNTMEMKKADALSKEVTYSLKDDVILELQMAFQCEVLCPRFNAIPNMLADIVTKGRMCLVVIPVWQAKSWWPELVKAAKQLIDLCPTNLLFRNAKTTPAWEFKLAYFY